MRRRSTSTTRPAALAPGAVHVWRLRAGRDDDRAVRQVLDRYRRAGEHPAVVVRDRGRPHVEPGWGGDVRFSLSRADELLLVAVTRGREIGVDVEKLGRDRWLSLPEHVLTTAERTALAGLRARARSDAFLRLWARKEAVLKAAGTGLAIDPALVAVAGPAAAPALVSLPDVLGPVERFGLVDLPLRRYAAAVAVERPHSSVVVLPGVPARPRVLTKSLRLRDLRLTTAL